MPKARQRPAGGMTAVLLSAQSMFALAACLFPDTAAISAQAPGAAPSGALDIALCDDTTQEMTSLKRLAEEQERAVDTFTNQRSDGGRHLLQRRLCSRRRRCATGMNTGCTGSHKFALSEGRNDLDVITKDYFVLRVTRTPGTAEEHTKDRKHTNNPTNNPYFVLSLQKCERENPRLPAHTVKMVDVMHLDSLFFDLRSLKVLFYVLFFLGGSRHVWLSP